MSVSWQADCYRRPLKSPTGEPLWELLLCGQDFEFTYGATCEQSQINSDWVRQQLERAIAKAKAAPVEIQVFRPQSLRLLEPACATLNVPLVSHRNLATLKHWLQQRASWYPSLEAYSGEAYDPLALDRPPPVPLSEDLWGDQWRFAAMGAGEFEAVFRYEPIPVGSIPEELMPSRLGIASVERIAGVVIDAGRKSMGLAQWLQAAQPAWLDYMPGEPDGLILEAGLVDRWVLTTFDDTEVAAAGRTFMQRRQAARGLHFLLVRPDDSGITHTGLWLLQRHQPR